MANESSLSAACSQLLPFGDNTVGGTPKLIEDIKYLQARENTLLVKLRQSMSSGDDPSSSDQTLMKEIEVVQNTRMRLFRELSNAYSSTQCSLSSDRRALQDQLAMVELAEEQIRNVQKNINALIESRNNKRRMVQITNYENDRYTSHTGIFKTMAYCSLFILVGITLNKMGWNTLGQVVIVIAFAVLIVTTIYRVWTNFWRSPMNWHRFEWWKRVKGPHYQTVWEHDVAAFRKGYNEAINEVHNMPGQVEGGFKGIRHAYRGAVSREGFGNATHRQKGSGNNFAPY